MNKSLYKLSIKEQIDWLARFVLIHSILYYDMNENVILDSMYDEYSKYLANLIKTNPKIVKDCYYYSVIFDFDGNTGFDLRSRLTKEDNEYLTKMALKVLQDSKRNVKEKGRN